MHFFVDVDIFIIGIIVAVAARYAYAHFRPEEHHEAKPKPVDTAPLPAAVKQRLQETAEANFTKALQHAETEFEADLKATQAHLTKQLETLGSELVQKEMSRYKQELTALHEHTEAVAQQASQDLDSHQADLKTKLQEEVEAEKKRLVAQVDGKLTDAVMSFILDTMQLFAELLQQVGFQPVKFFVVFD